MNTETATPTPSQRFAAHALQRSLNGNSHQARALNHASYWDSFPHSYTPEQVAAGRALLIDPNNRELIDAVRKLIVHKW